MDAVVIRRPNLQRIVYSNHAMNRLTARLQAFMDTYGYQQVETPHIGNADLFLLKAGDHIAEHLLTFQKSGQQFALRPEFTASAAYAYAQSSSPRGVVRWQFAGPVFKDDGEAGKPYTQKYSAGAEFIGAAGPEADAEILAMAAQGLNRIGVDHYNVMIGHAGLIRDILTFFDIDKRTQRFILNHRDLLHEQGSEAVMERLRAYLQIRYQDHPSSIASPRFTDSALPIAGGRTADDIAYRLARKREQSASYERIHEAVRMLNKLAQFSHADADMALDELSSLLPESRVFSKHIDNWRKTVDWAHAQGLQKSSMTVQPDVNLAWDYYTGIVFEIRTREQRTIAAGGRYDDLIGLVSDGVQAPAVGFAYYLDALVDHLPEESATGNQFELAMPRNHKFGAGFKWLHELRSRGFRIAARYNPEAEQPSTYLLQITEAGQLIYRNRQYTLKEIEDLIRALHDGMESV